MKRLLLFLAIALLLAFSVAWIQADAAGTPNIKLTTASAGPRAVEDTTEKAIARDYASAWNAMGTALANNQPDLLQTDFVGTAQDELKRRIQEQMKSGLRTEYVDQGHDVQAVFYSPEGSALQLRDVATGELKIYDGSNLIHSEQVKQGYLVVMTAAESRWKVRMLQQVK